MQNKHIMKIVPLFIMLFMVVLGNSQTLSNDFDTTTVTSDFVDFDGGTKMVINNP